MLRNECTNAARFSFTMELVILGTSNTIKTDKAIDFMILFANFFIYKCRFQDSIPLLLNFMITLKHRLNIEKILAVRSNKHDQFQRTWYPYRELLDNTNNEI